MQWGVSMAEMSAALAGDSEGLFLARAKRAYTEGRIDVDEFERNVEHVLGGGELDQDGTIPKRKVPYERELRGFGGETLILRGFRDARPDDFAPES